jgi:hypothetical protein
MYTNVFVCIENKKGRLAEGAQLMADEEVHIWNEAVRAAGILIRTWISVIPDSKMSSL